MRKIDIAISHIEYRHKSLAKQFDAGFGLIAEAYFDDAQQMKMTHAGSLNANCWLPTLFLFRHSIELFLKSEIVILGRVIQKSLGRSDKVQDVVRSIRCGGRRVTLLRLHDLSKLHKAWFELLKSNTDLLNKISQYNKWAIPERSMQMLVEKVIEKDSKGDFFRYPMSKSEMDDSIKSSWILKGTWWQQDPKGGLTKLVDEYQKVATLFSQYHSQMRVFLTSGS